MCELRWRTAPSICWNAAKPSIMLCMLRCISDTWTVRVALEERRWDTARRSCKQYIGPVATDTFQMHANDPARLGTQWEPACTRWWQRTRGTEEVLEFRNPHSFGCNIPYTDAHTCDDSFAVCCAAPIASSCACHITVNKSVPDGERDAHDAYHDLDYCRTKFIMC
jgi:hypothetical protein